jgi:hypothetical protein
VIKEGQNEPLYNVQKGRAVTDEDTPQLNINVINVVNVKSVVPLKTAYTGHCDVCGKGSLDMTNYPKPVIRFCVEGFDGVKRMACGDCGESALKGLRKETAA